MDKPYYKHDGNCWRFILCEDDSVKKDEFWITFCRWCAGYYLAGSNIKPKDIEWDKWGFRINDRLMDAHHAGKLIEDIGHILYGVSTIMANDIHYGNDSMWYLDYE